MDSIYFKATINDKFIFVETTEELINKLYDYFTDNGYKIEKLEKVNYYMALRNGHIVYDATDPKIVTEFIETNNKIKYIKNGE